ncbi:MAG: hypothetical protein KBO60_24430, partial [Achromobacter sp.]|nr:hypothetical protein [Achromobacter sp.]
MADATMPRRWPRRLGAALLAAAPTLGWAACAPIDTPFGAEPAAVALRPQPLALALDGPRVLLGRRTRAGRHPVGIGTRPVDHARRAIGIQAMHQRAERAGAQVDDAQQGAGIIAHVVHRPRRRAAAIVQEHGRDAALAVTADASLLQRALTARRREFGVGRQPALGIVGEPVAAILDLASAHLPVAVDAAQPAVGIPLQHGRAGLAGAAGVDAPVHRVGPEARREVAVL